LFFFESFSSFLLSISLSVIQIFPFFTLNYLLSYYLYIAIASAIIVRRPACCVLCSTSKERKKVESYKLLRLCVVVVVVVVVVVFSGKHVRCCLFC
jgi:hypothetical protein